jgi:hypothetical protein
VVDNEEEGVVCRGDFETTTRGGERCLKACSLGGF